MFAYSYEELQEAVELFDLIGLETKNDIKKKYLKLSKQFHPDKENGSTEKFQEITNANKILMEYADSFKFRYTKQEFKDQHPFSKMGNNDAIYRGD